MSDLVARIRIKTALIKRRLGWAPALRPGQQYPRAVAVTGPQHETLAFLRETTCRRIAEVGIYMGHTSAELARYLNGEGELHLFDFQDRIERVTSRLHAMGFHNVKGHGCSDRLLDSYNWPLMKLLRDAPGPIYDYILLDGAHTWACDALAFLLLDRLLMVGGYFDFDDYDWSMRQSPTLNPIVFPAATTLYTDEQIDARQVALVIDLLVRPDPRYTEIVRNKIFQKVR